MPYYLSIERNDHMHTPPPNTHHTHTHRSVTEDKRNSVVF